MRPLVIALLPLVVTFAGCLEGDNGPFEFRIRNETDETHTFAIVIFAGPQEAKVELFRETVDVAPQQVHDGAAGKAICRSSMEGRLWHTFEVDGGGGSTLGLQSERCAASIFTGIHDESRTGTTFE